MSGRGNGLVAADQIFDKAHPTHCSFQLSQEVQAKFGVQAVEGFWRVARARTDCPCLCNGLHDVCPSAACYIRAIPRHNSALRSSMAPGLGLAHSALMETKMIVLDMLLAINKTKVRRRMMKGKDPDCFRNDIDAVCQNTPPATCSLGTSQHCCGA